MPESDAPGPRKFPCSAKCGRERDEGNVFCAACYHRLPADMRKHLWRMAGTKAFVENVEAARNWLAEHPVDRVHRDIGTIAP